MANRARPKLFSPIGTLSARKPSLGPLTVKAHSKHREMSWYLWQAWSKRLETWLAGSHWKVIRHVRILTLKISLFKVYIINQYSMLSPLALFTSGCMQHWGRLWYCSFGKPVLLCFAVSSLFEDLFHLMQTTPSVFEKLSQSVAIHMFCQCIC